MLAVTSLPSRAGAGLAFAVGLCAGRHHLARVGGRRLRSIAAAFDGERHHLKRAFVLVALVPRPRRKDAQSVLAFRDISQLERLIQIVISLVRLIVEDHVNVITHAGLRIFVRHVAFQIAG